MSENIRIDWLDQTHMQGLYDAKMAHIDAGNELFDLSMINPDFSPPRILVDKLLEATVKSSNHRYSVSRGIKKLRQAFASKYRNAFAVDLDADRHICVTMGSKDGIANSLLVSAKPGDKVLLAEPAYPAHVSACHMAGLLPIFFALSKNSETMLSEIDTKLSEHSCKVVLLNFPNNPTGQTVDLDFYQKLKPILTKHKVLVINDFVYGEMGYGSIKQPSLLSVFNEEDLFLESYSLSKAYSVPGWRVGAMLGNARLIERLARLKSHIDYGIFLPLQIAAAAALSSPQNLVQSTVEEYERRAKLFSSGLRRLGWQVQEPQSGAVVWAKLPDTFVVEEFMGYGRDEIQDLSLVFANELLKSQGVFISPGSIFGQKAAHYVRFAMVRSSDKLYEVLKRLENFHSQNIQTQAIAL